MIAQVLEVHPTQHQNKYQAWGLSHAYNRQELWFLMEKFLDQGPIDPAWWKKATKMLT